MRLARVEVDGQGFWALLDARGHRLRRVAAPFAEWAGLGRQLSTAALDLAGPWLPYSAARLLAPLQPGGRVFGVGLNYLSHLARLGSAAPDHPLAYMKPASALVGPYDLIDYPPLTGELDYEVELVAVWSVDPCSMSSMPVTVCWATRWATTSAPAMPASKSAGSIC
jgi:2-keto-4-pentenoate hydratase/2-oxohepta-3-ene-1,7-dioic acid hydratase in catechol pathway